MAFKLVLVLVCLATGIVLISLGQTQKAYAHGCQAQGGCCTVGSACVEVNAGSPIFIMFALVGLGAVMMFAFNGRTDQRTRLGAIFNVFV